MSGSETGNATATETAQAPAAVPGRPPLMINAQYVRDLSIRVPGAPAIYARMQGMRPHVNFHLDIQVRPVEEGQPVFEVTLAIQCNAATEQPKDGAETPPTAFTVELAYSGIFTLTNVAQEAVEPVLVAECPRLLFPFARNLLADITREAGFPPVLLQPIDFVALWQARRAQAQAQSGAQTAAQAAAGAAGIPAA